MDKMISQPTIYQSIRKVLLSGVVAGLSLLVIGLAGRLLVSQDLANAAELLIKVSILIILLIPLARVAWVGGWACYHRDYPLALFSWASFTLLVVAIVWKQLF